MSTGSWSSWDDSQVSVASAESTKKILKWLALGLEALSGFLIIVIAVYLRFAKLHPNTIGLNWKMFCQDASLYATAPENDNSVLLYTLIFIIPSIFILLGEIEFALFSRLSSYNKLKKSERILKNLPRLGRIYAMFILGIVIVSFSTDYLKTLIVQPRPYFLTKYGGSCPSPFNGTLNDEFFEAMKSFPSHLAGIAGFCCMFAIGYAHKVHTSHSTPALMPVMSQGFLVLAVTASFDRYNSHFNSVWDILGGLILGSVTALYTTSLVSFLVKSRTAEEQSCWPGFFDFFIPRAALSTKQPADAVNASRVQNLPYRV